MGCRPFLSLKWAAHNWISSLVTFTWGLIALNSLVGRRDSVGGSDPTGGGCAGGASMRLTSTGVGGASMRSGSVRFSPGGLRSILRV